MSLIVNDVLAVLFLRSDYRSFHSALAVFRGGDNFYKMHARSNFSNIWFYDHGPQDIFRSETVAVLIRIGNLNNSGKSLEEVDKMLEKIPHRTDRIDGGRKTTYDCWIWMRMAFRVLNEAGVIACDVPALEAELRAFGARYLAQPSRALLIGEAQSSR